MGARTGRLFTVLAIACGALVAACATGPQLRTDYDRSVDFTRYQTFGFAEELGTDRAGYSSLITSHFKGAVRDEMEALGYRYTETDPDLIVNFYTRVRERSEVRSRPSMTVGVGYYGYRYGLYTAWPMYEQEVDTVHYRVGTANIDVVDAERKQLIWEGVAEGRLTRESLENPKPAIENVVHDLFMQFPTRQASGAGG
ncbi:DUF4136 domain-containing protein [Lentisalinibacter salinarum]|uniref:DUF4136 domain-containing protein n=1 Tax=Lentisalinibacter salinarum TaxID=2992239 RepID=UPI00386EFC5C